MQLFKTEDYGFYIEQDFRHRWLRPHHLKEKLNKYINHSVCSVDLAGYSTLGRAINMVKWGKGPIKVLCWTQMHGNESTATMAVIDLLNFFSARDEYDELRQQLYAKLEVAFVPMLNPDGAEAFSRRNALNIDPNRDAQAQQTPELQTLLKVVKEFNPAWCFNLHDQRNIFSAGDAGNTATISFLAASADEAKTLTDTRKLSMSLIGKMYQALQSLLPNHIGRYTDEYYHRALGEYFHQNDIPCILIESGAYKNDRLRDMARKANFVALLKAFETIASDNVNPEGIDDYLAIPQNKTNMLDLIIRDCKIVVNDTTVKADIGLLYEEKPNFETNKLERYYILNDLGDLQFQYGIEEHRSGQLQSPYENLKLNHPANLKLEMNDNTTIEFKNGIIQ